jgi:hypothetical protein
MARRTEPPVERPPATADAETEVLRERIHAELGPANETSLLDLVDNLLGKGVVVDGEVVLGLAGVDLIYLRLAALLAAADRVIGGRSGSPRENDGLAKTASHEAADTRGTSRAAEGPVTGGMDLQDLPDVAGDRDTGLHVRAAQDDPGGSPRDHAKQGPPGRWNPDPEDVRKGVMKLVLALAEFIRQLLERQAIRRMEAGTLSDEETERLGTALAQLEETLREMAERAGLDPHEVNLDLGPLGKLV